VSLSAGIRDFCPLHSLALLVDDGIHTQDLENHFIPLFSSNKKYVNEPPKIDSPTNAV
jgi:hypothetical protein